MRNFLVLFLCSFLLVQCTTSPKDVRRSEILARLAYDYLESGKYPEALHNFLEAEKINKDSSIIQNGLALTYFAREKYELALTHIQKAIQLDPKNVEAHNNLGRIYISLGNYKEAEKSLETALKDLTYTEAEKPLTNMGILYSRMNQNQKARQFFLRAIKANRNYCPAYREYGHTLLKLKNFESAGSLFDRAIKICQNSPEEMHYLSGLSYYQLGRKDVAVARLREVIKLYPENEFAEKSKDLLKIIGQDIQ